ncbi:hypothetical protein ANN_03930 [Periplaneta americana]|uniref:PiggyBac transposable element-derived protein domain-containing protein n=1 Tax=Periplaneta americana TaxID=6978 RepID=A0ABQ8T766_PERAM|nr:hypothetical protein ANN_03930 [Periplaneta americana]
MNVTATSISEAEEVSAVRSNLVQQSSSKEVSRMDIKESTQRQWSGIENYFHLTSGRGDCDENMEKQEFHNVTPVQCFELVFSDDIIDLIVDMSNLYTLQRNHSLNLNSKEVEVYTAILLLTGYLTPQYMRMFWEVKSDTHNEMVANSIRRNRFFEIHQYLHMCENINLPTGEKFAKTLVPYYGRHSANQHIHRKPLRFRYKLWSGATRFGISSAPDFKPYNLYFDKSFASYILLSALSERGTERTGTLHENRLKICPLMNSYALKKEKRGAMSFKADKNIFM